LTGAGRAAVHGAKARRADLRLEAARSATRRARSSFSRRPSASKGGPEPSPRPFDAVLSRILRSSALRFPRANDKRSAADRLRAEVEITRRFVDQRLEPDGLLQHPEPRAADPHPVSPLELEAIGVNARERPASPSSLSRASAGGSK